LPSVIFFLHYFFVHGTVAERNGEGRRSLEEFVDDLAEVESRVEVDMGRDLHIDGWKMPKHKQVKKKELESNLGLGGVRTRFWVSCITIGMIQR
jgi:hypothetical protein